MYKKRKCLYSLFFLSMIDLAPSSMITEGLKDRIDPMSLSSDLSALW